MGGGIEDAASNRTLDWKRISRNEYSNQQIVSLGSETPEHIDERLSDKNVVISAGNTQKRGRSLLNDEQARVIYQQKPLAHSKGRGKAKTLATTFGVSVKTVRDIWIGRTWYRATFALDTCKPVMPERLFKKPGRPKGSKDGKPRTRKWHKYEAFIEKYQEDCPQKDCFPPNWESFNSSFSAKRIQHDQTTKGSFVSNTLREQPIRVAAPTEDLKHFPANFDGSDIVLFTQPHIYLQMPLNVLSSESDDPFHDDWAFWTQDQPRVHL